MAFLLAIGCATGGGDADVRIDPSPWTWESTSSPAEPRPADEVAAGIEQALPRAWSIDPRLALDAATAYVAAGDGACPALDLVNGLTYAEGNCVAASGLTYHGWVQYADLPGLYMEDGWWHDDFRWMTGTFRVEAEDGTMLAHEGDLDFTVYDDATGRPVWESTTNGDFHWRGPSAPDTWLDDDVVVMLTVAFHEAGAPVDGGPWVAADGSVARLGGTFDALELTGFVWPGVACTIEPDGVVEVHDDRGIWYTVHFGDGACDGCGAITDAAGASLGDACPDFTGVREWGADPWSR
jgi:hypothetical protein